MPVSGGVVLSSALDLVRGAPVPAFMRLAGRANWWAPGPLTRFHRRFGPRKATRVFESPRDRN
ncbi:hypothetical protein ACFXI8_21255 [Streptomyces niveus]|uniref:hypothetical protein n=1 Tax=Streptomyces niveus TaxID=193462 RepID=UPI00369B20F2